MKGLSSIQWGASTQVLGNTYKTGNGSFSEQALPLKSCQKQRNSHSATEELPNNPEFFTRNQHLLAEYENHPNLLRPLRFRLPNYLSLINSSLSQLFKRSLSPIPSWEELKTLTDWTLNENVKNLTSRDTFKALFLENKAKYHDYQVFFTDGSKKENKPSYSIVSNEEITVNSLSDTYSIFSCEAFAILKLLEKLNTPVDSKILQTNNTQVILAWVPSHQGIEGNEIADTEAKNALNKPIEPQAKTSLSDFKKYIHRLFMKDSGLDSTNTIIDDTALTRRDQVILTRLKIGHTNLTHCYRPEKKDPPVCPRCGSILSVKHLITSCLLYQSERTQANLPMNPEELFTTEHRRKVIKFLKLTKIYNKI
ncbi:uncharacterized protein LOC103580449 [Microplitis demolitor]|uniref:uncharacterized protein LOC103580449 n=1 Tax=Microplitis demolitor TaxID=69319 RepID=UPI0004CCC4B5|nr:uncharacterized protein LOC103580449 [Microplitis demolitor]